MVSAPTYNSAWDGLLEIARARHYFAAQEKKFGRIAFSIRFVLAMAGCGGAASLIYPLEWLLPYIGTAVTVLVIFDLLWDGLKRCSQLQVVNTELADLEVEYRAFWDSIRSNSLVESDALELMKTLQKRLVQITTIVDVPIDEKSIQLHNSVHLREKNFAMQHSGVPPTDGSGLSP